MPRDTEGTRSSPRTAARNNQYGLCSCRCWPMCYGRRPGAGCTPTGAPGCRPAARKASRSDPAGDKAVPSVRVVQKQKNRTRSHFSSSIHVCAGEGPVGERAPEGSRPAPCRRRLMLAGSVPQAPAAGREQQARLLTCGRTAAECATCIRCTVLWVGDAELAQRGAGLQPVDLRGPPEAAASTAGPGLARDARGPSV